MNSISDILKRIEILKAEKPEGWQRSLRQLVYRLTYLDDPYSIHEWHGNEMLGRKVRWADCPSYDDLGDESEP